MLAATPQKVLVQQRVLARYREPLFSALNRDRRLSVEVVSGAPLPNEGIAVDTGGAGHHPVTNRYFRGGPYHYLLCWQSGLLATVNRTKPDVVILEANPRLISNLAVLTWCRIRGRRAIGWGLGQVRRPRHPAVSYLSRMMMHLYLNYFDEILAYSRQGVAYYESFPSVSVRLAPNAVEDAHYRRLVDPHIREQVRREWREEWQIEARAVVALAVGRLVKGKGLERLVRAIGTLRNDVHLVIVGEGPERASLAAEASRVGALATFTGHLEGEELACAFASGDIFVLPGLGGLALFEAIASGLPAIVASGDGTEADLVEDGVNGFVVPEEDSIVLMDRIRKLALDERLRQRFAERSAQKAMTHSFEGLVSVITDAALGQSV